MDDDVSGDAVLDDDAPDLENDHDDEPTEDSADLLEPDPAEEDTPLSVPGTEAAAGTAVGAAAAETLQATGGPTVLERMRSAGINNARALEHLQRGWVRMDGQVITDPNYPAAPPARLGHPALITDNTGRNFPRMRIACVSRHVGISLIGPAVLASADTAATLAGTWRGRARRCGREARTS